jgi:hypothetical protein
VLEVTETLSKVTDTSRLLLLLALLTASPMYTFVAMLIDWLDPTCVHVTPSGEMDALNVLPFRTIFTQ